MTEKHFIALFEVSRKVTEMFAWLAVEENGSEGIIAGPVGRHELMPLVGGDRKRMEALRPVAEYVQQQTGLRIKLVRFSEREELESIGRADA